MEEVVAAARRIERILQKRPATGMENLMESMNRQIQILTKDLAKAHEKLATQPLVATSTAALAAPPSLAVAAAQHPPAPLAPPQMAHPTATPLPPMATPLPPMATAQPPQYLQGSPSFFYEGEEPPYFRGQRRQDRRPMRCFLCDEEGHFAYRCPARTLLQHLLRQQAQEQARRSPRGQVLELPATDGSSSSSAVHLN